MSQPLKELRLLWRDFTWRHWKRAPGSTAILVLLLALGVGAFFSIRLANHAAVAGFNLFTEQLAGESDFILTSPSGELPDEFLPEIRALLGDRPVSLFPILEATATATAATAKPSGDASAADDGFNAEQFRILGLDLFALPNLVYLTDGKYLPPVRPDPSDIPPPDGVESGAPAATPRRPQLDPDQPSVFISSKLQKRDDFQPGDHIPVIVNDRAMALVVAGILPETEFQTPQPANLLVMDLPVLQEITGKPGVLHRIEARIPPGVLAERWITEGRDVLAQGAAGRWQVDPPQTHRNAGADMTAAFRLNLTILSLLALLVGIYLILQALEAAVARRRGEIAVLRSLGVEAATIRRAWLLEALSLGFVGTLLGLLAGWAGAQFAVRAVARTVNSLYYSNTTEAAGWNMNEALVAFVLGIGASGLAGWLPARDAAETPPASALQRGSRGGQIHFLERPALGLILVAAAAIGHLLPPLRSGGGSASMPLAGYFSSLFWVLGGSVLTWFLFPVVARLFSRPGRNSATLRYAGSQFHRPTGRHRLASAGLVVAVGMAAAMSIMIASFENTVVAWINQVLKADLFIATQGVGNSSSSNRIRPETWRAIVSRPEVSDYDVGQLYRVRINGQAVDLTGYETSLTAGFPDNVVWVRAPGAGAEKEFGREIDGDWQVCVSETFSNRLGIAYGESFSIPTPRENRPARVLAVYADYGNERGSIVVPAPLLREWYDNEDALSLAIHLKDGVDPDEVRRRWQPDHPGLVVRTNSVLRNEALRVFDETFLVTHVLKWIGLAVAVAGQGLAMISILLGRRRELETLKELGMTRREIARSVAFEGAGLSVIGATAGLAVSIALGNLLVFVINRQSFGWTLNFRIPPFELLRLALAVIVAGAVVAWFVGHWAARLPSDDAAREA